MTQIVYTVFENERHEGSYLKGVFSTLEKANKYLDCLEEKNNSKYISFEVVSYILDEGCD